MDKEYVKQLEKANEELKSKLDVYVGENEKLSKSCDVMGKYIPKIKPYMCGYICSVNRAAVARLQEEKSAIDNKIVGYVLFIKDKRICTVANLEDGRKIIQDWFDTGYDGIPIGG